MSRDHKGGRFTQCRRLVHPANAHYNGLESQELIHAALIDKFLASYHSVHFDVKYLSSLKDADDRDPLNDVIHISPDDDDDVDIIWDTLREGLSNEDSAKFKPLIEFGRSRTEVGFNG